MIEDFRDLADGADIACDLCIIGGGAAGISVALEFLGSNVSVCLLESGGFDFEPETQALYEGVLAGLPYPDLDVPRLRYFGGSTNHWSSQCAPLDALDMAPRHWVTHSGWPIARDVLEPFYERAHEVCDLGENLYGDALVKSLGLAVPALDGAKLRNYVWQYRTRPGLGHAPLRFGEFYRAELEEAANVRVLLHANVTDIHTNDAASVVAHVAVAALDGPTGVIRPRHVVLACGGIENARVLLLSDKIEPQGLGNRHDVVGRYFLEHITGFGGSMVTADSTPLQENYNYHRNTKYWVGLALSEGIQASAEVANCAALLQYVPDVESGVGALRRMWADIKEKEIPDDLGKEIWRVITDIDGAAGAVWQRLAGNAPTVDNPAEIVLDIRSEQVPNPDSRVMLAKDLDALGLRRTLLDWRMGDQDRRTMEVMGRTLGEEFGRLGMGRVRLEDWLLANDGGWTNEVIESSHHMGTTRMASDPSQGVVDEDCRVHGVENLYVAGSSVFPTGGHVNPTLTIVALALRLADTIKGKLAV
ncbi:MAG: FAD-dependent oxidoreductase [Alphaproteobacteria bacterium]